MNDHRHYYEYVRVHQDDLQKALDAATAKGWWIKHIEFQGSLAQVVFERDYAPGSGKYGGDVKVGL